jgi:hypothetical protein
MHIYLQDDALVIKQVRGQQDWLALPQSVHMRAEQAMQAPRVPA